ncbi:hypothetical protein [Mesorhizobium sp. ORM16]|uniref:hypothetical protein n=1 Tax=Mesorhizobium sp. ORM16 TaxID=3376989 RepID=UPI003857AA67
MIIPVINAPEKISSGITLPGYPEGKFVNRATMAVAPITVICENRSATARCPAFRRVSPKMTIDVAAIPLAMVRQTATRNTI